MSGIINDPPAPDGSTQATDLSNPLLAQTEQGIEARLEPATRSDYMKIVVAGMSIALDKGASGFMAKLRESADPIADCAKGAVALVLIMKKQAKGVMPQQAMIPAGLTLMLHGLDFIDRIGNIKIGDPELVRATSLFTNNLLHQLGITPKMLETLTGKVHQIVQDPDAMAKLNLKAGITRHPEAAMPTNIPGISGGAG